MKCSLPLCALLLAALPASAQTLEIKANDRISVIGNTLADRMQHDGWLDTLLHLRFSKEKVAIRHLGFAADELTTRLRSASFGSPDDWLKRNKTDVVFDFFGYNESFGGDARLPKFRKDLDDHLKHLLKQKYNGSSAPRIVLFSPIAHENLEDRNLPSGVENNKRLAIYSSAMREVAKANGVVFVDLFQPSQRLYEERKSPLTINGVHLNEAGNRAIAEVIDSALFGAPLKNTEKDLQRVRAVAQERNFYWFNRYRTVDGYSIYGGRADLKFVGGQTNRVVMQREMEVLDVMTANRDERIWEVALGRDLTVTDANAPPFIDVVTNKPGPLPGGKHVFLDGEEAIKKMTIGKNFKVNLFASEKEFKELVNPVQMQWDTKGRLWVAVWPTYPHWKPGEPMNDKLLIFEDTNGDGKADKMTVFADDLHCPTGFEFYKDGVIVAHAPDLLFLRDTDGDGKADKRERILSGIDSADTHHTANSFVLDPGGALYFQEGTFHHTQVETPWGPPERCVNAGVFRYEPRTHKFEVYVGFGFANPHGHVFDRWGQDIVVDGTGAQPYHGTLFSGRLEYPQRHGGPPQVYKQKTRPCPGMEILSSKHFPEDMQGNLLVGNVIGFHGILQYKLKDKGASLEGIETEPIVSSSDPNFRPSDFRIGPDGAIYFLDWHNPIIGHMQHNLRDPSRDREHGRIYRVTYEGRALSTPAKIAGEPIEKLLDLLKSSEDRARYRARIELGGRDSDQVVAAVKKWVGTLDAKDAEFEHHMMEALWAHQYQNVVDEDLLKRMLRSPDFRARAAATKTLCYWRDRVRDPLGLLRVQINDSHPRVRLEAIRALSFFPGEEPLAVAVELLAHPDDAYLRFVFNETLATLERRIGKFDRGNIAASLLTMLEKGKVPATRAPTLIETVTRHGGPKELAGIWALAQQPKALDAGLRRQAFDWLAEAALTRRAQPKVDARAVLKVLDDTTTDAPLNASAIRLIAAWKIKEAAEDLRRLAANDKLSGAARHAAIDSLASLGDAESRTLLNQLTSERQPLAIRVRAAIALGQVDMEAASLAAAKALASAKEGDDVSPLVEAFLSRKNGPEKLAAALAKETLSADGGKRILRAMFLAGRNDPPLASVASKFAGLDAAPKPPTVDEIRELAAEALKKGDLKRGEQVFRRADLGCMKCHSINKAGGDIGPDLGPIGGSSPIDYIITSILDPNAAIKEEYLTKVIDTTSGRVVTGVVVERNKNVIALKDATGKVVRIAADEVDSEGAGKSLMPDGVTRILTRAELLDLIRFVSELGKPGPLAPRKATTIQRWKRLREVPLALKDVPHRDALRDLILGAGAEAWESVYAMVDGTLPAADLKKPGASNVVYLQGEINVTQAGLVEFKLTAGKDAQFWVNDVPVEGAAGAMKLETGRHRVSVRLLLSDATPGVRLDVTPAAKSNARVEIVHSD